jgi:hypothetical protein
MGVAHNTCVTTEARGSGCRKKRGHLVEKVPFIFTDPTTQESRPYFQAAVTPYQIA